jgi:uncharacterized protein with beta-barrel porin domain
VGAQYNFGTLTLTPAARLGYASVNIDGFTEAAPILALQYSDRNVTTGFWTARIRAATPFFGSSRVTAYGEVGYGSARLSSFAAPSQARRGARRRAPKTNPNKMILLS